MGKTGLIEFGERIELGAPLASRLENDATLRAFAERARQARKDGREGRGVGAVFFGKKGSGRTTAARALAHELGLALHRVDLERVVSQYIGETEKNLEQLFAAAEAAGAILFFDEADSIFGKRSEVKDSHDRYANVAKAVVDQLGRRAVVAVFSSSGGSLERAAAQRVASVFEFPRS